MFCNDVCDLVANGIPVLNFCLNFESVDTPLDVGCNAEGANIILLYEGAGSQAMRKF